MAQLLVVHENCAKRKVERGIRKTEAEDHAVQPIGDIIGVFEDKHQFSSTEQDIFDITQVSGFTKAELITIMPYPETKIVADINRNETEYWKDPDDGKWKQIKEPPKFRLSIADLTISQKQTLTSEVSSSNQKQAIIETFKNRIKDDPANFEAEK